MGQVDGSVSHAADAPDPIAAHFIAAVADKGGIGAYDALLQAGRDRQRLGWGTRLKAVADAEVSPQLVPRLTLFLLGHGVDFRLGIVAA